MSINCCIDILTFLRQDNGGYENANRNNSVTLIVSIFKISKKINAHAMSNSLIKILSYYNAGFQLPI